MTAEELAARLTQLEDDNARLLDLARGLVATVELLAELAGTRPATVAPARPQLRVLQGGAS